MQSKHSPQNFSKNKLLDNLQVGGGGGSKPKQLSQSRSKP